MSPLEGECIIHYATTDGSDVSSVDSHVKITQIKKIFFAGQGVAEGSALLNLLKKLGTVSCWAGGHSVLTEGHTQTAFVLTWEELVGKLHALMDASDLVGDV